MCLCLCNVFVCMSLCVCVRVCVCARSQDNRHGSNVFVVNYVVFLHVLPYETLQRRVGWFTITSYLHALGDCHNPVSWQMLQWRLYHINNIEQYCLHCSNYVDDTTSSLPQYHYFIITTSTPLPQHHYLITAASTPLPQHNYLSTTTWAPQSLYHYCNTTIATPLLQHH